MPVRSAEDDHTRRRLLDDAIIWEIARSVSRHDVGEITGPDGGPSELFAEEASARYREQGGLVDAAPEKVGEVLVLILTATPEEIAELWRGPGRIRLTDGLFCVSAQERVIK